MTSQHTVRTAAKWTIIACVVFDVNNGKPICDFGFSKIPDFDATDAIGHIVAAVNSNYITERQGRAALKAGASS